MPPDSAILIVDDDEGDRAALRALLESRGHRVEEAPDGGAALALARARPPRLVVTDVLMPQMDGYQLCRELAADQALSGVPVVFYTATYTDPEDRSYALGLGAARVLAKPEGPEPLVRAVEEVLAEGKPDRPAPPPLAPAPLDDLEFHQTYSRRLVAKLEHKLGQLDQANTALAAEIVRKEEAERVVRHLAFHDPLTGLINRSKMVEEIADAAHAGIRSNPFALLVVDIDGFREINHALGQENGDRLLRAVAERLANLPRSDRRAVARLGGDEFALLLDGVSTEEEARRAAEVALDALDASFDVGNLHVDVTASVGIAMFPAHAEDPALVLRHAEVAMCWAKGSRGLVPVYRRSDDPFQPRRVSLISGLRQAIRRGELKLHFQPKVDLARNRVVGAEALVRWRHPEHGWLPPNAFISLAEQTGQIQALTGWLLRESIEEYAAWQREGLPLALSLNLSPRNLQSDQLAAEVAALLEESHLHRPHLIFEITESAILQDPARARNTLERISELGIQVAVDDFGTGYSSLSNLKLLPVNELKIDKSFVMDMVSDANDAVIVRSTIDLAHNLSLRVTAEGVETEAVLQHLVGLGCDMAQGYFVAQPMSGEDLRAWLRESAWPIDTAGR